MSISSVRSVTGPNAVSSATPTAPAPQLDGSSDDAQPRFSGPAQFLGRLQDLMKSDPAQAKQALNGIADKLRSHASQDGADGSKLNALADKFQKASDTGDLSALAPTGGHGPHVHPHHTMSQKAYTASDGDEMQSVLESLGAGSATGAASRTSSTSSTSSSSST
jgi:hypothetical protein